jgi:hypothetical protein
MGHERYTGLGAKANGRRIDYLQAADEMDVAIGRRPR